MLFRSVSQSRYGPHPSAHLPRAQPRSRHALRCPQRLPPNRPPRHKEHLRPDPQRKKRHRHSIQVLSLYLGYLRTLEALLVRRLALDGDVAPARRAADGKAVEILDTAAAKPRADEAIEALAEVEQIEQAARNRKDALTKEAKTVKPSVEVKP